MTAHQDAEVGSAAAETYRKLTEAMRRGAFPPGSRLPGERDLAARSRSPGSRLPGGKAPRRIASVSLR